MMADLLLKCPPNTKNCDDIEDDNLAMEIGHNSRELAKKSGFVSIRERMKSFEESNQNQRSSVTKARPTSPVEGQFATLQELFSSRARGRFGASNKLSDLDESIERKPKIPIMKLNKDDWNVKCWEDRLRSYKLRNADGKRAALDARLNRRDKLEQQVEVFKGRIEEVACKLEKMNEGLPMDEKLQELMTGGSRASNSSHEWTDLLKAELESGLHRPTAKTAVSGQSSVRWPPARKVGRIFEDDQD